MSADQPGSTTYAASFGPRSGTIHKNDPYASKSPLSRSQSPRQPGSPRDNSASLNSSRGALPVVDTSRLAHSLSEQYKLKKYRNEYANLIEADVDAFRHEEADKMSSAHRRRDDYRTRLQDQIRQRSASRELERQKQVEAKKAVTKDFDAHLSETLRHKNHQREKHQEYCRQIQQQHNELSQSSTKRKTEDEAIAQMMVEDSHRQKKEEDDRKNQKRALQLELAQEMQREHQMRSQMRSDNRQRRAEEDRQYLAFVDAKAAEEEHDRANHIRSRQKVLATVTLPKIEAKPDVVPDYINILKEEKRQHAVIRAEEQRKTREALQRNMADKSARAEEEKERDRKAREILEADAKAYHEEQRQSKVRQRDAAKANEHGIATQIEQSIRRQYNVGDEDWKTGSINTSTSRNSPRR